MLFSILQTSSSKIKLLSNVLQIIPTGGRKRPRPPQLGQATDPRAFGGPTHAELSGCEDKGNPLLRLHLCLWTWSFWMCVQGWGGRSWIRLLWQRGLWALKSSLYLHPLMPKLDIWLDCVLNDKVSICLSSIQKHSCCTSVISKLWAGGKEGGKGID